MRMSNGIIKLLLTYLLTLLISASSHMILSKTANIRVVLPCEALHVNVTVLLFVRLSEDIKNLLKNYKAI